MGAVSGEKNVVGDAKFYEFVSDYAKNEGEGVSDFGLLEVFS